MRKNINFDIYRQHTAQGPSIFALTFVNILYITLLIKDRRDGDESGARPPDRRREEHELFPFHSPESPGPRLESQDQWIAFLGWKTFVSASALCGDGAMKQSRAHKLLRLEIFPKRASRYDVRIGGGHIGKWS